MEWLHITRLPWLPGIPVGLTGQRSYRTDLGRTSRLTVSAWVEQLVADLSSSLGWQHQKISIDARKDFIDSLFILSYLKQTSINTKRDLECLRSLQKKIEDEQACWNAQKQREEARLEREDQKLKKLAKTLEEKQEQYEKDSKTLQEQIDLHASRGVDMGRLRGK